MMEKKSFGHRTVSARSCGSQGCLPTDTLWSTLLVTDRKVKALGQQLQKASFRKPHSCNTLLDILFPSALRDQMFFPLQVSHEGFKNK